ncbi:hypothetical protein ACLBWP_03085 [Microbacterium sp. M1A1_1b]
MARQLQKLRETETGSHTASASIRDGWVIESTHLVPVVPGGAGGSTAGMFLPF